MRGGSSRSGREAEFRCGTKKEMEKGYKLLAVLLVAQVAAQDTGLLSHLTTHVKFTHASTRPSGYVSSGGPCKAKANLHCLMMSEFELYDTNGSKILLVNVIGPAGNTESNEGPNNLIDGDNSTDWCDQSTFTRPDGTLIFVFQAPATVGSYRWATGSMCPLRDITQWTLHRGINFRTSCGDFVHSHFVSQV